MGDIDIDTRQFDQFISAAIAGADTGEVGVAITVEGDPVKYWGALEFGSRRGKRPWPNPRKKTTTGKGGRVFSKQAPEGFVFRFAGRFAKFLADAYERSIGAGGSLPTREGLKSAATVAGKQALTVIAGAAPVDKGDLKKSLKVN